VKTRLKGPFLEKTRPCRQPLTWLRDGQSLIHVPCWTELLWHAWLGRRAGDKMGERPPEVRPSPPRAGQAGSSANTNVRETARRQRIGTYALPNAKASRRATSRWTLRPVARHSPSTLRISPERRRICHIGHPSRNNQRVRAPALRKLLKAPLTGLQFDARDT